MVKQKSSATSATRKKHAKKSAAGQAPPPSPEPKEKKQKGNKKEPRQKVYIPPSKPLPIQPDPLDTMGLARILPPDLVVVLRKFGKRDGVTKKRALEEFQTGWVDPANIEVDVLVSILPVWLHHAPALFLHPSKRIRLLTATLHQSLLHIPTLRDPLFFFIRETASAEQASSILGSWCMAAHDVDHQVSHQALKSWNEIASVHDPTALLTFVQKSILEPGQVYLDLNPSPPVVVPHPTTTTKKVGGRTVGVPPAKREDPDVVRSKGDGDEESERDRKARLRVGAFGALIWILDTRSSLEDILPLLSQPSLWSSLSHTESSPLGEGESFGWGQPGVRKAAWGLVRSLLKNWKTQLGQDDVLGVVSTAVLRSAWGESDAGVRGLMWVPLLEFLKEFPDAWALSGAYESDDGEDSEPDNEGPAKPAAYADFLQFLQLGCSGSPIQGYPIVVIVLSTLSSPILAPVTEFFASFWAALDGRALTSLDRTAANAAFLSSLLECTLFLVRRLWNDKEEHATLLLSEKEGGLDGPEGAKWLVGEQFKRVWEELLRGDRLKVHMGVGGKAVGRGLLGLEKIDSDLFKAAWVPLVSVVKNDLMNPTLSSACAILKVLDNLFEGSTEPRDAVHRLIDVVVRASLDHCDEALRVEGDKLTKAVDSLVDVMTTFEGVVFQDSEFVQRLDAITLPNAYRLLSVSPRLLLIYISRRADQDLCLELWHNIVSAIIQHLADRSADLSTIMQADLPDFVKPPGNGMDAIVNDVLKDTLSGTATKDRVTFLKQVLTKPRPFLTDSGFKGLLETVFGYLQHWVPVRLNNGVCDTPLDGALDLMSTIVDVCAQDVKQLATVMPDVFVVAFVFPTFSDTDDNPQAAAIEVWRKWEGLGDPERHRVVLYSIKEKLCAFMADCHIKPTSRDILRIAIERRLTNGDDTILDFFPPSRKLDEMLDELPSDPIDASLAVLDPLLPPATAFKNTNRSQRDIDSEGNSSYARIVSAMLQVLAENRHLARHNIWTLRHLFALYIYAEDFLNVPSATSFVFGPNTSKSYLRETMAKIQQVTTYLLTISLEDSFHPGVIKAAAAGQTSYSAGIDGLLVNLIFHSAEHDNIRDARILRRTLQHLFSNVTREEADQWMTVVRKFEKSAPQTSMVIASSITEFAPEPPRLDRYRNELAANLLGILANKANTEGLLSLRKLAATAPNPDSDVIFLPQQRAVNVIKACQQWIGSDEEIDEELESEMTLVFFYIAPLLQNVPGGHWDFIFDVIENNLENCSFDDESSLVMLARTLRLVISIQDLTSSNKSLRADWQGRQILILTLIRDLVVKPSDSKGISLPRSICRELVLSIVQDLPSSLVDHETLPKMCHLLTDSSTEVQKMAYQLLHEGTKKHTEHLVIETAVDVDDAVKIELPAELLDIISRSLDPDDLDESSLLGNLLGWQILFDLFNDASMKVRSGYVQHLRNLDIVATRFIPNIFGLLDLYDGMKKAFKLEMWSVDEFYMDYYDSETPLSPQLLAAHLFYRALLTVPSLIRKWLLECTDRQLSTSIVNYTSQHFSPVIIRNELIQVKSPEATAELIDENMTIKVAQNVNEVTASYLVDEHHLELTLKLPNDWPLHNIEIKDLKKVGVLEDRWRAWVLGVQQIIWSQNGRIVDGLTLFKKNVSLHFEGQVECAICYSIISIMDGSLPRKPCRTCKNRFHAACLYKWFNTSHSSSCPLCRSDIM